MSADHELLSVAEAVEVLESAGSSSSICLGAEGFWLTGPAQFEPSLDHILDLSSVTGPSPRTNASLALAVVRGWPSDPNRFAVELVMTPQAYPCPCCGHMSLGQPPGSFGICPICSWEDDPTQLRWPTSAGGANNPSLITAQLTFLRSGVSDERSLGSVRRPAKHEPVDTGWRVIDLSVDSFERSGVKEDDLPEDWTVLYWWRPTFWRRDGQDPR